MACSREAAQPPPWPPVQQAVETVRAGEVSLQEVEEEVLRLAESEQQIVELESYHVTQGAVATALAARAREDVGRLRVALAAAQAESAAAEGQQRGHSAGRDWAAAQRALAGAAKDAAVRQCQELKETIQKNVQALAQVRRRSCISCNAGLNRVLKCQLLDRMLYLLENPVMAT